MLPGSKQRTDLDRHGKPFILLLFLAKMTLCDCCQQTDRHSTHTVDVELHFLAVT